jgi:hypothetical protein
MTDAATKVFDSFVLPINIVSKVDVGRLVAEVERVDNELTAAAVRQQAGSNAHSDHPVFSDQLNDFLKENELSLDAPRERTELIKQLRLLKDKLPIIHMTFAVTADNESLQTLVKWLRESIHPQAVIEVGMQPSLVAGVYVRTPNHVHDFSLRAALDGKHDLLISELEALKNNG